MATTPMLRQIAAIITEYRHFAPAVITLAKFLIHSSAGDGKE
jgi:hypothetical protein